tara:strand:+ start:13403 stop:13972 length:570 start_codon:yes stop_codon:yes gene_type:complete
MKSGKNTLMRKFDLKMELFKWLRRRPHESTKNDLSDYKEVFMETCKLIKAQRMKNGISLEMLSRKTKISKFVLEAIENGHDKYLPERTYLKQMLKAIEFELGLPKDRLKIFLKHSKKTIHNNNLKVFAPGNINIFASWEGNLVYLILMFTSIITLNKYQKFLADIKTLDTKPISKEEVVIEKKEFLKEQ